MATTAECCLTNNRFDCTTRDVFKDLLSDKDFVDVTLVSDVDKQTKAHKAILSSCSPFFKQIFIRNPHAQPLIYLNGVSFGTMESILKFIYLGEVKVAEADLELFIKTCAELEISGLSKQPEKSNERNMQPAQSAENIQTPDINYSGDFANSEVKQVKYEPPDDSHFVDLDESKAQYALEISKSEIDEPVENEIDLYRCSYCDKTFRFQSILNKHLEYHKNKLGNECHTCGKLFKTKETLKAHTLRVHVRELKYECEICSTKFFGKAELESHYRVHSDERLFPCSICSKSFKSRNDATKHENTTHFLLKPYQCKVCQRFFSQSSNRNTHMRKVHYEEWSALTASDQMQSSDQGEVEYADPYDEDYGNEEDLLGDSHDVMYS
eukprot:TRINITY_DN53665_c0_g1_i1.p1 TRINITY_DN53665_c0_g1~~TRINITY_DN53665_c0_g1_i1.p1  ORF type:complete len:381 (+),score=66.96 TRINITY_DN53665_c0_g1_i1:40-1182(+)